MDENFLLYVQCNVQPRIHEINVEFEQFLAHRFLFFLYSDIVKKIFVNGMNACFIVQSKVASSSDVFSDCMAAQDLPKVNIFLLFHK